MKHLLLSLFLVISFQIHASYILIPMDAESQKNHLKAYFGDHLERLKAVKRQLDPDNVFSNLQSIPV